MSDYHLSDWNATNTEDDEKWDKGETITIIALICFVLVILGLNNALNSPHNVIPMNSYAQWP